MIVVYLLLLVLFLVLYMISLGERYCQKIRSPLKRIACILYQGKKGRRFASYQVEKDLQMLYPGKKSESELEEYYLQKISRVLLMIFSGNLLAIALTISSRYGGTLQEEGFILRKPYGEGAVTTVLEASDKAGEVIGSDIALEVKEQKYEEKELQVLAKELEDILPMIILGNNASQDAVSQDLNLIRSHADYPFSIGWESDAYEIVDMDGRVKNEELKEKAVVVLTAIFQYEEFKQYITLPFVVVPRIYDFQEKWNRSLKEELEKQEKAQAFTDKLILPNQVGGYEVEWKEIKEDDGGLLLLLLAAGGMLLFVMEDKKLHEMAKNRNNQLLMDYPMLVQKLVLYMGAGMTTRNAFTKICKETHSTGSSKQKRFLLEEMLLACHEMDSGISETSAYELFGKRCRLPQYTKLVSLLSQNLKRGSSSLQASLREEAKNAFEERKNMARKLGEEAGTKLLLPMMLMLMVVMVLIILPAYFSFAM